MDKIAIVVVRYGIEINGGAEMHARILAEHMTDKYAVDIITTCAKSNITWENHFEEKEEIINEVKVIRFETEKKYKRKERSLSRYLRRNLRYEQKKMTWRNLLYLPIAKFIYRKRDNHHQIFEEWLKQQGPHSPSMIEYIKKNRDKYTAFIFFTYLYYPTYFGLQQVGSKSILIPTAHNDSPFYFSGISEVFSTPATILYNTISEKKLVENTYPQSKNKRSDIVGVGFDCPDFNSVEISIKKPYVVYIGRLDRRKGYKELINYFLYYKKTYNKDIRLVLIGGGGNDNDKTNEDIIFTSFVSDDEKLSYLKNSEALIIPSRYESLSMVTLEAMSMGKPVLATAKSDVLKDHIDNSKAGYIYNNKAEFTSAINSILNLSDAEKKTIANNGISYVESNYSWQTILDKIDKSIHYIKNK